MSKYNIRFCSHLIEFFYFLGIKRILTFELPVVSQGMEELKCILQYIIKEYIHRKFSDYKNHDAPCTFNRFVYPPIS